ncbi:hypothetical protein AVR91_0229900 [Amycolatopsis keratiniphila subsp. keratiniphila]|uniref:Uncharacterized protein n=1 Tax=Amycolatopsis keratiniphila subsp. keratiniphila TaxID=227715 RepID=A0A1W2LLQ3_9PSEU|nr:hypothetical protein AVR91_0229900 [Amycolatopsis keratiniphila subsp. keratiniphila]
MKGSLRDPESLKEAFTDFGSGGAEDTGGSNPNRHSRDAPHHATAALRSQLKYVKAPFTVLDAVKGAFTYLGNV